MHIMHSNAMPIWIRDIFSVIYIWTYHQFGQRSKSENHVTWKASQQHTLTNRGRGRRKPHTPHTTASDIHIIRSHSHSHSHYANWNILANCNIAIMVSDNDDANWIAFCAPAFLAFSMLSIWLSIAVSIITKCHYSSPYQYHWHNF